MYTYKTMIEQDAISVIRDYKDDPHWDISDESVREVEMDLFFNNLHAEYVRVLDDMVVETKDWNSVDERNFWSITASLEDRAKSVALVLERVLGSKSKSASN